MGGNFILFLFFLGGGVQAITGSMLQVDTESRLCFASVVFCAAHICSEPIVTGRRTDYFIEERRCQSWPTLEREGGRWEGEAEEG